MTGLKKIGEFEGIDCRDLIVKDDKISLKRQCELLSICRSTYYYEEIPETELNLKLMRIIDELYTEEPSGGSRRITEKLKRMGYQLNRKRIQRLMQKIGIKVIYPRPNSGAFH